MIIREMTEDECRDMLAHSSVARLACARDNQPYVVPVHVDFSGGYFYGYSTTGRKIDWMRENPRVCLEFDELTSHSDWSTIVITGHYEELSATAEHEHSRQIAQDLFQLRAMWWEPGGVPFEAETVRAPVVYRIRVEHITGRRGEPSPA